MTAELEKLREAIEQELLANGWIIDSNSANRICAAIEAAGGRVAFPEPPPDWKGTLTGWLDCVYYNIPALPRAQKGGRAMTAEMEKLREAIALTVRVNLDFVDDAAFNEADRILAAIYASGYELRPRAAE
jgi:hypothetical protein